MIIAFVCLVFAVIYGGIILLVFMPKQPWRIASVVASSFFAFVCAAIGADIGFLSIAIACLIVALVYLLD